MPKEWKEDKFFTDHSPIVMSMRYGQNERIAVRTGLEAEKARWGTERDWSRIRYANFAVATHIRAHYVEEWEAIDPADIIDQHGEVYDSHDPLDDDEPLDLENYPLMGPDGKEKPIYNLEGHRIARRRPRDELTEESACGILCNLLTIQEMYKGDASVEAAARRRRRRRRRRRAARAGNPQQHQENDESSDADPGLREIEDHDLEEELYDMRNRGSGKPLAVYCYPQALLGKYGNVQATRMFRHYNPQFLDMEKKLRADVPPRPAVFRTSRISAARVMRNHLANQGNPPPPADDDDDDESSSEEEDGNRDAADARRLRGNDRVQLNYIRQNG
ncbi:uncharacterized protein B0H18DRAFT_1132341, partial [Fomitopsis serialis]|uniref:uncharacterized protein n=1 Tax=Fomitopsis serialis TaxID=139415 RepID=UPI002007A4E0